MRIPGLRFLVAAPLLFLLGCDHVEVRREYYPGGRVADEQAFLYFPDDGYHVPHGFHQTWYPDGGRKSLELYERGVLQGYSMRWDARGRLVQLDYCVNGACCPRHAEADKIAFNPSP